MHDLADADLPPDTGAHRLIRGDCLSVLPTLEAETVDVVVTSPPYNIGISYRGYDDRRAEDEYLDWLIQISRELRRVMKADSSFFLNISGSSSAPWLPFELIVRLRPLFVLQNHIVWIKSIATKGDAVGHFKPVGGQRFLHHNHEHLFHLTLSGDVKLDRLAIGVPFKAAKFHHPSTFPVALPRWCIRLHGRQDALVLDPFMGTGTTVVAAELEGARGIGIELDPAYAAIAQARLAEARHVQQSLVGV
jgi:site-specific DNA-methyltransferase (adenine-specific)